MDTTSILNAVNAYRNQMKMAQEAPETAIQEESNKPSFMQMVEDAAKNVIETQRSSEAMQMDAMTGKVELSDLVTAVTNAELTLDTVVAVRDRVISAYQEIIRMPI